MSLQNINTYTYSPGFQLGQYHNAVLCISGNVQSLYLDGTLIATKTGTTNVLANYSTINQILIGCAGDKSSGFSGYLDDFRMYNYTLNQAQVSNLYINRNIVAYYPFDNSLNSQTPNYATLAYDANIVGNAATITTSTSKIGSGSLQLTNTTSASPNYITSSSGFSTSTTNGLSVSLWFKTTGVSSTRMRLFDLCSALGSQGISVDINGTNQILAGNGIYIPPIWSNFYDNFSTFVSSTLGYTGGTGTSTRYFSTSSSISTFTFTTNNATWTYNDPQSVGYAVDLFYKGSAESPYFFNNQDAYFTDTSAWGLYVQTGTNTSTKISTPLSLITSGSYTVSFALMQSVRTGGTLGNYINIKVSLGSSYIIFNNTGSAYTTTGNVSISAYYYSGSAYTTPSTLMASNPAINNLKTKLAFVTLTFTNMSAGTNSLAFEATTTGDGFMVSQIGVNFLQLPSGYLYYFKFRGDAVNSGSLSSSVPTASISGSTPNPNGTIGGKTCLSITTQGDYVYFPAFGSTATTAPPLNFSFGFWFYNPTFVAPYGFETNSIADKNFNGNSSTMWNGDINSNGYQTPIAAPTVWNVVLSTFHNGTNAWVHIFYTVTNATTFTVYVNGVSTATTSTGSGSFQSLSSYYHILGRQGDGNLRTINGCGMREFIHYNRTLTATEVNTIYTLTA